MTTPAILGGRPAFEQGLDIVRPLFPTPDRVHQRFAEALASGQVTNMSRYSRELEDRLAAYAGVRHCAAFCNGEAALIAMLRAAGLRPGAEVITPAYTFSGTAHGIALNGLTPVFADIDGETWTVDADDVARRITARTGAILAAPLYGNPCDHDALAKVAAGAGVRLFYDSASGCGSRYRGRPLGGFGDGEMFSFHATKVFTTMEGGAVLTDDADLHEAICMIRNFGKNGREADCTYVGFNGKMMEIAALIGLELLPELDDVVRHRNAVADRYRRGLAALPGVGQQRVQPHGLSSWLYYQVTITPEPFGLDRDELIEALAAENITGRRFLYPANHQLTCYRDSGPPAALPVTERVARTSVALPVYSQMALDDVDRVVTAIGAIHDAAPAIRSRLGRSGAVPAGRGAR